MEENIKKLVEQGTVKICSSLFQLLNEKGLVSAEINKIVKDVFNIVRDGGAFQINFINSELEKKGWDKNMFDENMFEHILALLEKEFSFSVESFTVH